MFSKITLVFIVFLGLAPIALAQSNTPNQSAINKKIVTDFYNDLWMNNRTDNYKNYVAEQYTVHDIGSRKNVVENAIEQKEIADFFWNNGQLKSKIDFQIAEGDLVATRWTAGYEPETILGKLTIGTKPIPIINVFRIRDGKIVEIWNHRHDIDTNQTLKFVFQGLLIGLLLALIPTILAFRYRKKLKNISPS